MLESELVELECPWCTGPQLFEVPPCPDGHGEDCPERVCTGCSGTLVVGLWAPAAAGRALRVHLAVVA